MEKTVKQIGLVLAFAVTFVVGMYFQSALEQDRIRYWAEHPAGHAEFNGDVFVGNQK